ncbi:disulfide bond formation protein B [Alphaproteobacteria bacterium]|nr:disulfide bond formation protein B [Alphaproteobacteria bacterium]
MIDYKKFFTLSALFTSVIVLSSFFFEFYFNLIPCKLCLVQRYMWILVLICCFLAILIKINKKIMCIFSLVSLFLLSIIALYHSGIEHGLIKNIFECATASGLEATSIEELSNIIMNTKNNDCSFPQFNFFGITLTNLSFIASSILLILNLQVIKKILSE